MKQNISNGRITLIIQIPCFKIFLTKWKPSRNSTMALSFNVNKMRLWIFCQKEIFPFKRNKILFKFYYI